jgi:hypothetical protein
MNIYRVNLIHNVPDKLLHLLLGSTLMNQTKICYCPSIRSFLPLHVQYVHKYTKESQRQRCWLQLACEYRGKSNKECSRNREWMRGGHTRVNIQEHV